MLSGRYRVRLGEREVDAPEGAFVFIPRGTPHTWQNAGADVARFVAALAPADARFERFFLRYSASSRRTSAESTRLRASRAKHRPWKCWARRSLPRTHGGMKCQRHLARLRPKRSRFPVTKGACRSCKAVTRWRSRLDTADTDLSPFFEGLPYNQCQSAHWGYVFEGRVGFKTKDGEETFEAGDAYYVPAGHTPVFYAGAKIVEFSPTSDLDRVIEVVTKNIESAGASSAE